MTSVHFAHMTDLHLTAKDFAWGTLAAKAPALFAAAVDHLNSLEDLDFVLITGDVLDAATQPEVDLFRAGVARLQKPWHYVPGNHDGFIDPRYPDAFQPHEALPLLDPRLAEPIPYAQRAYWSRPIKPGVHLIGLDSRLAADWGGEIGYEQMAWLTAELEAHPDDLIVLAVHHPPQVIGLHNDDPFFKKFILENGPQLEALLDRHPNVRVVLAGHHHLNRIALRGGRLHINTAALTGYPCQYRTIRIEAREGGWHAEVEVHTAADLETQEQAYEHALNSDLADKLDPHDHRTWAALCVGRPEDKHFSGMLP